MAHWLIFVGLGPLIGLAGVLAAFELDGGSLFSGPLTGVFTAMTFVIVWAYIVGLIPALVATLAVWQLRMRQVRNEWLWVSLIGLGIGLVFEVAFAKLVSLLVGSRGGEVSYFRPQALIVYTLTCLIPTLACWLLSWRLSQSANRAL